MPAELPGPYRRFVNGILPENPVFRQVLGTCPTLAVTNTIAGAVTMAGATAFVLICANIVTSLMRRIIQPHLRILVFTVTIAAFVTVADRALAAFLPDMSAKLGPYIPLIVVNCIIIARCEICAAKQGVVASTADAVGQSLGFLLAMLSLAVPREILGMGTFLKGWLVINGGDLVIIPKQFVWGLMAQPPGAFFTFGLLMGAANWIVAARRRKAELAEQGPPQELLELAEVAK